MAGVKGRSGGYRPSNPGGRPKGSKNRLTKQQGKTLTELAQKMTPMALGVLESIAKDPQAPASARVTAANSIIERGYGRAPQTLEHTGLGGGPIMLDDLSALSDIERQQRLLAIKLALSGSALQGEAAPEGNGTGNGHAGNGHA